MNIQLESSRDGWRITFQGSAALAARLVALNVPSLATAPLPAQLQNVLDRVGFIFAAASSITMQPGHDCERGDVGSPFERLGNGSRVTLRDAKRLLEAADDFQGVALCDTIRAPELSEALADKVGLPSWRDIFLTVLLSRAEKETVR